MSYNWLQRLIRKKTRPVPFKKATRWRDRFAIAYAFMGWNTVAYVAYLYYNGRLDQEYYGHKPSELDALTPAQRFALRSEIPNAKIISSTDFKVEEFNLDDYKHLQVKANSKKREMVNEHDEDNVA